MQNANPFAPFFLTFCLTFTTILFPLTCDARHFQLDYKAEHDVTLIPCPIILKDGVYIGTGLGYDFYKLRQDIDLINAQGLPIHTSRTLRLSGLLGDVLLGYGQYFSWFYLGGEGFAKYTMGKKSFNIGVYQTIINVRTSFGASILPGIKITDSSLVYLRIGYDRNRLKISEHGTLLGNDSRREWVNGIDFGVGFETAIFTNVSLRGDYIYTRQSSFETNFDTEFSPFPHEFSLAVLYHFAC